MDEEHGWFSIKFLWGSYGWGWKMYGIVSTKNNKMWFLGFSRQFKDGKNG